ncbi:DUF3841 domain-containing protein [Faecalimonas sp.]
MQHQSAYNQLQREGVLHANENHLFCEDDLRFAYDWMAEQLAQKVGKAPSGVHYPIWAWYQWEGRHKRLDMRTHRRWYVKGTPIVLLTLEIPDQFVLLSDYDMWHCVLNHGEVSFSGDIEKIYSEREIRESWSNIFKWNQKNAYWPEPKTTQAVFWEVRKEWVVRSEFFVSG